jgi:hypothetical protein
LDINLSQYPVVVFALTLLNVVILGLHFGAWVWSRRVARSLRGQDGQELASLIAFVCGGVFLVRLVGMSSVFALVNDRYATEVALIIGSVAQILLLAVLLIAIFRVRKLDKIE